MNNLSGRYVTVRMEGVMKKSPCSFACSVSACEESVLRILSVRIWVLFYILVPNTALDTCRVVNSVVTIMKMLFYIESLNKLIIK